MIEVIIFFLAHWYLSIFCQTFFLHRYASHHMFTMSRGWEKFFFIFTWICKGSNYLSPYGYGIMHRMHHAYADTEKDPHSPKYSKNMFHMMWLTRLRYTEINWDKVKVEDRFYVGAPKWRAWDKFASSWFSRISWGAFYVIFYIIFAEHWWLYLLLPIHFLMAPIHGAIVNWYSHTVGYQTFKMSNTSTNFLPFDFLLLGENYHNNHHRHSTRANFGGVKWHELDITYLAIRVLDFIGIIKINPAKS